MPSVTVLPSGSGAAAAVDGADTTLVDSDGIAYDAYGIAGGKTSVVIVRPDGVVGAIVFGAEGVTRYFSNVFSGIVVVVVVESILRR